MPANNELVELSNDFEENINKVILLTGAGFSRDLDGYLASDIAKRIVSVQQTTL